MAEHTSGPWRACNDGDCCCGQIWDSLDTGKHIATVNNCDRWVPSPRGAEFHANARLIAAAPELLAACERMREYLQIAKTVSQSAFETWVDQEMTPLLDAAIAKAKGQPGPPQPS